MYKNVYYLYSMQEIGRNANTEIILDIEKRVYVKIMKGQHHIGGVILNGIDVKNAIENYVEQNCNITSVNCTNE